MNSRWNGAVVVLMGVLALASLHACAGASEELVAVNLRTLEASSRASSRASGNNGGSNSASATAVSTGGTVVVESEAVSEAQNELKKDIAEAVADAVATVENGGDATAEAQATAEEIGRATATAIAQATVKITVDGQGFASGSAKSSSRAIAKVTVTAIAEAFAKATGSSEASSRVRAEATESDVAEAAANAVARAESTGGTVLASQRTVARAVAEVIAKAVASALATVKNGVSTAVTDASAESNVGQGQASVDSQSITKTGGSCNVQWNADYSGDGVINDGHNTITGSNEECCNLCNSRSDCKTWTRISWTKDWNKEGECWMRNTVNGRSFSRNSHSGVKSGASSGGSSSGGSSCSVQWGVDLRGGTVINNGKNEITGSDSECCEKCNARSDCKAWTRLRYSNDGSQEGECWLRSSFSFQRNRDATNSGTKSGSSGDAFGSGSARTGGKK